MGRKIREDGFICFFDATDNSAAIQTTAGFLKNDTPVYRERFIREAKALSGISHANVTRVLDHGEEGGACFMVMEKAGETHLSDKVRCDAGLPWKSVRPLLSGICGGLDAIHGSGTVHANITPKNITISQIPLFLSIAEDLKILPSGFARFLVDDIELTPGHVSGTIPYMSPEQATPDTPIDVRSDIYSFGVMVYELLTGSVPFRGNDILETLMMHRNAFPSPPSKKAPHLWIPASVDALVMRALEKDPGKRFQSALELKRAVDGC